MKAGSLRLAIFKLSVYLYKAQCFQTRKKAFEGILAQWVIAIAFKTLV